MSACVIWSVHKPLDSYYRYSEYMKACFDSLSFQLGRSFTQVTITEV